MPKGDRLKLKADPEDGTTPIANLLLEAVAMSHLSGLQKGAIVYLWRCTYGWVGDDGKRKKEAKITLGDWIKALDRDKSRISKALKALENMNIIHRRVADVWGGYYYRLNTSIASWNSDSINLAKLAETVKVVHLPTVGENANSKPKQQQSAETTTVGKNNDATVGENATQLLAKTPPPTLYKENLNKVLKKEGLKISSPFGDNTAKIFYELDHNLRGYRPTTKRKAEAASIIRMLKAGYTTEQILKAWQTLKGDNFYADKELWMMTVEGQIGAQVNKKSKPGNQPSIEKYKKQKYGHMVQR